MIVQPVFRIALIGIFSALVACAEYGVTVNDKVVYNPEPLLSDLNIADAALAACLSKAIASNKISKASQLQALNCRQQNIAKLDGLQRFTGIRRLNLSQNSIENLTPLSSLTALESLNLGHNHIVEAVPLYQLPALQFLDLSGNHKLICPAQTAFVPVESVLLPLHCNP